MGRLTGRVALITGAVGGIGVATARLFAAEGADLVLTDRVAEGADRLVAELAAAGRRVIFAPMDVTSRVRVFEVVADATAEFGAIDILVNNAGITYWGTLETIGDGDWRRMMDINLTGVFLCTQAVVDGMKARRYGRIVNIGSLVGKVGGVLTPRGQMTSPSYAASKGGVMAMTKTLAKDLGPFGITVNAVAPGPIETPMMDGADPSVVETLRSMIPLGRLGQPDDVASAVLFLASDEASWITGHWLDIDGGLMMA
jgi:3-oxoacyl-[acyl-carrier protein] reductase